MSINILVVGATGKQGGAAIATLFEQKNPAFQLRFLTRKTDSSSARKLAERGATPHQGDLSDPASLKRALQGVDRAFLVTDLSAGEQAEVVQGKNFIDAAKAAGIQHLVFTSVSGADEADNVPHFRSKYQIEKHLLASGLSYTILRPVAFMENFPVAPGLARFATIGMFYGAIGHQPLKLISVTDIGAFAGKALAQPDHPMLNNAVIDLAGGNYDLKAVRKAYKNAQRSSPWFASWVPRAARNIMPHDIKEMTIYLDRKGYPDVDVEKLRSIHPKLQTLEDWVRANSNK